MGIESDQLVYEYLSRVGDLAQRRQLPSGDRMRLVAGLRDEIDRRRAKYEPETPASVRRILERIGTPEEVLETLGAPSGAPRDPGPAPAVPAQRGPDTHEKVNVPPHLAGLDELGPSGGGEPDWWRVTPGPHGAGPQVEGFAGGIEFPDLFEEPESEPQPRASAAKEAPAGPPEPAGRAFVRFARRALRGKQAAAAAPAGEAPAARPKPHAFLLLAAVVLAAGAVSGSWLLLVVGWALAYASRVLGPTERKVAVFGLPGAVFAGAVVWLWGRQNGRWGEPLGDEGLADVFPGMWPWLVRGAAVASAVYLTWRSRRRG